MDIIGINTVSEVNLCLILLSFVIKLKNVLTLFLLQSSIKIVYRLTLCSMELLFTTIGKKIIDIKIHLQLFP